MGPRMRHVDPTSATKSSLLAKGGRALGSELSTTWDGEHSTTAQESQCPRENAASRRSLVLLRLRSQKSPSRAPELSGGSSLGGHCVM